MYIIQLAIKRNRPVWSFLSSKCHYLATSTKFVSRHVSCVFQAKHSDIWNNNHFKFNLSRSYGSHLPIDFKTASSDTLETLDEHQIESSDCKNKILGLVSSYYNLNEQIVENKDLFMILYDEYKISLKSDDFKNLRKYQEQVINSDDFQKFLETVPSHLETMSVGDVVDVLGGLILLGIPNTNLLIAQCVYKLLEPEVVLGFSEIAKLYRIFNENFKSIYILQYSLLVPALKSLLMNFSFCKREDLISLSQIMSLEILFWLENNPEIVDTYLSIISDALNKADLHQDVYSLSVILNGVYGCFMHYSKMKKQFSHHAVQIYTSLMDMLEPHIEQMTFRQFSYTFSNIFRSGAQNLLLKMRPEMSKNVITQSKQKMEKLLNSDLPFREKLRFLEEVNISDLFLDDELEFQNELLDFIPNADELTLLSLVEILRNYFQTFIINDQSILPQLVTSAKARLLELLHTRFSNDDNVGSSSFRYFPYYPYLLIIKSLRKMVSKPDFLVDFQPYVAEWIESGYVCDNQSFIKMCDVAIPVLDLTISENIYKRIENILLSEKGLNNADRILNATLFPIKNKRVIKTIEMALITAIERQKISSKELVQIITVKASGREHAAVPKFTKFISEKIEAIENIEESIICVLANKASFLSENMTNRMLKYYSDHFNSIFLFHREESIFLTLLRSFDGLSRLPKHMKELEQLSKYIFDTYFGKEMSALVASESLFILCNFGIYLDEHIQTFFSDDYLETFYKFLREMNTKKMPARLKNFVLLNQHIVLHRPDLNIPWLSEDFLGVFSGLNASYLDPEMKASMSYIEQPLKRVLSGHAYYKRRVRVELGLLVDYEYFVDSNNQPVHYSEALMMDPSETDIRKCALLCGRYKRYEYLANDVDALSVYSANRILSLRALGYEVVFVPVGEWEKLHPEERFDYLRDKMRIESKSH